MNLKDLNYFITIAQTMNFRKAADLCGVSQPSLSIQLKKLEKELGVTLFERSQKNVILSQEGEELIGRAKAVLLAAEELKSCAKELRDPYEGKLTLGAFPTLSPYLFPRIFAELCQSYPKMKFYLIEEKTNDLLNMLIEGKLDAAFIALPYEHPLLQSEAIFSEDFLLATSQNSPLSSKKSIEKKELNGDSLLLLTEGHCLRDQSLQFCSNHSISEHHDFRASSLETLRQMVAAGIGMTLIPQFAQRDNDNISYIPFKAPAPKREIALFWRKQSAKAIIFEEIADELKNMLNK